MSETIKNGGKGNRQKQSKTVNNSQKRSTTVKKQSVPSKQSKLFKTIHTVKNSFKKNCEQTVNNSQKWSTTVKNIFFK